MTTEKMPDVIWAYETPNRVWSLNNGIHHHNRSGGYDKEEYFRAQPIRKLLKQARDALALAANHSVEALDYAQFQYTIAKINEFLGDDK